MPGKTKEPRQLKELRGLMPWTWDSRIDEHPPGDASMRDFKDCFQWSRPSRRASQQTPAQALLTGKKRRMMKENGEHHFESHLGCETPQRTGDTGHDGAATPMQHSSRPHPSEASLAASSDLRTPAMQPPCPPQLQQQGPASPRETSFPAAAYEAASPAASRDSLLHPATQSPFVGRKPVQTPLSTAGTRPVAWMSFREKSRLNATPARQDPAGFAQPSFSTPRPGHLLASPTAPGTCVPFAKGPETHGHSRLSAPDSCSMEKRTGFEICALQKADAPVVADALAPGNTPRNSVVPSALHEHSSANGDSQQGSGNPPPTAHSAASSVALELPHTPRCSAPAPASRPALPQQLSSALPAQQALSTGAEAADSESKVPQFAASPLAAPEAPDGIDPEQDLGPDMGGQCLPIPSQEDSLACLAQDSGKPAQQLDGVPDSLLEQLAGSGNTALHAGIVETAPARCVPTDSIMMDASAAALLTDESASATLFTALQPAAELAPLDHQMEDGSAAAATAGVSPEVSTFLKTELLAGSAAKAAIDLSAPQPCTGPYTIASIPMPVSNKVPGELRLPLAELPLNGALLLPPPQECGLVLQIERLHTGASPPPAPCPRRPRTVRRPMHGLALRVPEGSQPLSGEDRAGASDSMPPPPARVAAKRPALSDLWVGPVRSTGQDQGLLQQTGMTPFERACKLLRIMDMRNGWTFK